MNISSNEYSGRDYEINFAKLVIECPKVIARIKLCGTIVFTITDNMSSFEMPTKEQCENLKKTFGIEVELVEED